MTAPHNRAAERAVLGACLLEGQAAGLAVNLLRPEDFYVQAHQQVFDAIVDICNSGGDPDEVLVQDWLESHNLLDDPDLVHQVVTGTPSAANMERYAAIVAERSALRRVIEACTISLNEALIPGDAQAIIDRAASRMAEATAGVEKSQVVKVGDALLGTMEEIEARQKDPERVWGLATGLQAYDNRTGGLHGSQLAIIAAHTSVGKTALALTWLDHICMKESQPALYFTLEMPTSDIIRRLVAMRADITFYELCSGYFPREKWDGILQAFSEIEKAPLWIDHTPAITLSQVASRSRALQAKENIQVVIVDYLQIMSAPPAKIRERQIAQLSVGLKTLARELEIPVIALSQFRRPPADQPDRWPRLSDLRESGALEQNADVVVILHRKREKNQTLATKTALDIAKQRNGVTGPVAITFLPRQIRFMDQVLEGER